MTGHVIYREGKLVHDRETCGCPLIDFPEQVIPGQLDVLSAISEDEEGDDDACSR